MDQGNLIRILHIDVVELLDDGFTIWADRCGGQLTEEFVIFGIAATGNVTTRPDIGFVWDKLALVLSQM